MNGVTTTPSMRDTIVACATAPGRGAIAIVRVSGPRARRILAKMAPQWKTGHDNVLRVTTLRDREGAVLDRALVSERMQPNSYTGDNLVELHLHGSPALVELVIRRAIELGARGAEPGEFTLRAFLNGRMSLADAEGVADLIASSNESALRISARHVTGEFSTLISRLSGTLEAILAEIRAACDFPDDVDLDELRPEQLDWVQSIRDRLQALIDNARVGLLTPRRVVLCGAPNAGKSTLANAIAGETRVIVDPEPGTTRDPIEISVETTGGAWLLIDTAGIRADAHGIEARGIDMSRDRIQRADVSIWLVDPTNPQWPPADLEVTCVVGSKEDLTSAARRQEIEAEGEAQGFRVETWLSAVGEPEPNALRNRVCELFERAPRLDEIVVVRQRQLDALVEAESALSRLLALSGRGATLDLIAVELEVAGRALGRISGRNVDDAVLDRIFSTFCLGK